MNLNYVRILIVRLSAIGDVLQATPVARNLKTFYPSCHITWLASPPASEMLRYNKDIDELLIWNRQDFDQAVASFSCRRAWQSFQQLQALFAGRHFDLALDVQGLFLTGLITRLSHAPRRIGIHERHEFNHLFMTERAPDIKSPHKIRRYLTALSPLGITASDTRLSLALPSDAADFAHRFYTAHHISLAHRILMVNVRTTWPDKNWPPAFFAETLKAIPENIQIVFCGTQKDLSFIQEIQRQLPRQSFNLAGETSLLELASLFTLADLLLTEDTGSLHIAAAVGLPTLSLWGPTHPSIYGPLNGRNEFVITPHTCHSCCKTKCRQHTNACMNAILPQAVIPRLLALLKKTRLN